MHVFCLLAFLLAISSQFITSNAVKVNASGIEYVEQFTTAIVFYIRLINDGMVFSNVTIVPGTCCLTLDPVDCEVCNDSNRAYYTELNIMIVNPPAKLALIPQELKEAKFYFRNFYPRYRRGNCSFAINIIGRRPQQFSHTIKFNTYPDPLKNESVMKCDGIDQDADRSCTPVDCAIKYRGKRNFYRNSTGRCEKVVPCNTRGKDNKIIAYYDWEENMCHSLDWTEENTFRQFESDMSIPQSIDIENAVGSKEFHNFEPAKLEQDEVMPLECNHGKQVGIYCRCDDGWQSTGLHEENGQYVYSWCNAPNEVPYYIKDEPKVFTKNEEIVYCILIGCAAVFGILLWIFIMYQLVFWRTGIIRKTIRSLVMRLATRKKWYSAIQ